MKFYQKRVLPKLVHLACSSQRVLKQREKVVPLAEGCVLEIGIGSGLNLPYYDRKRVRYIWGLDPSVEMWQIAGKQSPPDLKVEFIRSSAERIPLAQSCVDSIVVTYALCTIPNVIDALHEMRRVLKPSGSLLFCEHGAAPDERVRRWQNRVNPLWQRFAGGCNLNRTIPTLISQSGFVIQQMSTIYIPGWKPACFNYWGMAN